jgi:hypothetical protein
MYTCAANFWDLSIVQGPFSVAPCETRYDSQLLHRCVLTYVLGAWSDSRRMEMAISVKREGCRNSAVGGPLLDVRCRRWITRPGGTKKPGDV